MTEKEKKVVFTLIGIMVVILIIAVCINIFTKGKTNIDDNNQVTSENAQNEEKYVTILNDGTKLNNSEELKKPKKYKDIEISEIQITKNNNGNTVILANAKNTASTDFKAETVKLILIGENDETIIELMASIKDIKAGETEQFDHIMTADFVNIKDFKIEAM